MLNVSANAGNGLTQDDDIIGVVRAIEYRTGSAAPIFGGRPVNYIKVANVRGDSMCPTIGSGDLIFADVNINRFNGDDIYVFSFNDKIYVKRPQTISNKLLVVSDNQTYREWGITSENEHRFMVFGKALVSQSQTLKRHN